MFMLCVCIVCCCIVSCAQSIYTGVIDPPPHLTALRNPTDVVPGTRQSDDAAMVPAVLVDTVRCQVRYGAVPVRWWWWWWVDNVNTRCFAAAERSMYYNIQCIEKTSIYIQIGTTNGARQPVHAYTTVLYPLMYTLNACASGNWKRARLSSC